MCPSQSANGDLGAIKSSAADPKSRTTTGLLARFAGFVSTFCAVTVSIQVRLTPVEQFPLAQYRERSASSRIRPGIAA